MSLSHTFSSADTLQLGPLEPVLQYGDVTDIAVMPSGAVWLDRGRGMEQCTAIQVFRSPQIIREYAVELCAQLGKRLDDACPIADACTLHGVRVHAVLPPLVPVGASITIRLPSLASSRLEQFEVNRTIAQGWAKYYRKLVQGAANILITGGTGVGKTTLLKALLAECDPSERIVTVEETRELGLLSHNNVVSLVTREANVEGVGEVDLSQLVKATLRMRPDRIVLGECRGQEILDVMCAFNSGHRGGIITMHANALHSIPSRLAALGYLAGLNPDTTGRLACDAFDVVIHMERMGSQRYVADIGMLKLDDRGVLCAESVATWKCEMTATSVKQDSNTSSTVANNRSVEGSSQAAHSLENSANERSEQQKKLLTIQGFAGPGWKECYERWWK